VSKPRRARFVALADLLARRRPDVDPNAIAEGRVTVDGRFLTNSAARVRADATLRVEMTRRLRGDVKLSHALSEFAVPVVGRVAVDIGASAGGFTTALLDRGAGRVYAIDVGVGQLLGRLRVDPRVVNLEGHNLGAVDTNVVTDTVELIVVDVSYLSIAAAISQLERLRIHDEADLVALVKPTFELSRATLAATDADIDDAVELAVAAVEHAAWTVHASCSAPRTGQRGAREAFIHARRTQ